MIQETATHVPEARIPSVDPPPPEIRSSVDEDIDLELVNLGTELDLPTFSAPNKQDVGALAFLSGVQLEAVDHEPTLLYNRSKEAIDQVQRTKIGLLSTRISENKEKIVAFKLALDEVELDLKTKCIELDTVKEEQTDAGQIALRHRLQAVSKLAHLQRQDATLEQEPRREPLTRLQSLDETTQQIPSSTREVQIAYTWRRVLQYQKDYDAARELTAGLERNGITYSSSRFMVASGYAILLGAGAAIGALLDEAAVGNYFLERLFGAIQLRLGFIQPADAVGGFRLAGSRELLPGIAIGLAVIFAFLGLLAALFWFAGRLSRSSGTGDETPGPEAASRFSGWLASRATAGVSLAKLLPWAAAVATALLLFLAVAPNLFQQENSLGFSITRTILGFLIALAVAAVTRAVMDISLFPVLTERLRTGQGLGLLTPGAGRYLLIAVVSGVVVVAATTMGTGGASAARWPLFPVGLVTAGSLLVSCGVIAFGQFSQGLFRTRAFHEKRLYTTESALAHGIGTAPPAASALDAPAAEPDMLGTAIGHKWRMDLSSDVVLKRILLSGAFAPDELNEFIAAYTALSALEERRASLEESIAQQSARKAQFEKDIQSREKSTQNYESRISRLEQQALGLQLLMDHRYQSTLRQLREGYLTARSAYLNQD